MPWAQCPERACRGVRLPPSPGAMTSRFWRGRRVFVTGHTGFKGSWLCLWLHRLGTRVTGYALAPPTKPNLFTICGIEPLLERHYLADIRDEAQLLTAIRQ